ncbi:MAG: hypothetical protein ACHQK8_08105, partial [Bacteroidia bacterium]
PRPFTVPLFYKIARSDPRNIVAMQKIVHSVTTFLLVFVLLLFFEKAISGYLLVAGIYLLMSWWNIFGWTFLLLSESLSMSLMFCWLASFLLLFKKPTRIVLLVHTVIVLLFSFTRDSWPYILIAFYFLNLFIFYFLQKEMLRKTLFLLVFSVVLFFVQKQTAQAGDRYRLPIINSIIIRILPVPEYLNWFTDHGMPCAERLKKDFSHVNFYDTTVNLVFSLYSDSSYRVFHEWVSGKGQKTYITFLLTHPRYFFLLDESSKNTERVLSYNLSYAANARGYSYAVYKLFPVFNWAFVLILFVIAGFVKRWKEYSVYFLWVVFAVFTLNALLSYNADAFEVERHLLVTQIIIQFMGIISVALLLDHINWKRFGI